MTLTLFQHKKWSYIAKLRAALITSAEQFDSDISHLDLDKAENMATIYIASHKLMPGKFHEINTIYPQFHESFNCPIQKSSIISKTLVPCCGLQVKKEECHGTEDESSKEPDIDFIQAEAWKWHRGRHIYGVFQFMKKKKDKIRKTCIINIIISVPDLFCS